MTPMNYYQHHIGDFNSATRHLTRLERSIYRDLLDVYYDTETPLELDESVLSRRVMAKTEPEKTALKNVLIEFFTSTPLGWENNRAKKEILKYQSKQSQKKKAGMASASVRWGKKVTDVTDPLQRNDSEPNHVVERENSKRVTNQEPVTNNHKPITIEEPPTPTESQPAAALAAAPLRAVKAKADPVEIVYPENLRSEKFKAEWDRWMTYRNEIKKPIKSMSMDAALAEASKEGSERTILAIQKSIAQSWQGLFFDHLPSNGFHNPMSVPKDSRKVDYSVPGGKL